MKNFWLAREQMDSFIDQKIIEGSPIMYKPRWIGRYQLEYGKS